MKLKHLTLAMATVIGATAYAGEGVTAPYSCWTRWEINGNDYVCMFRYYLPPQNGTVRFSIEPKTSRAAQTLNVSRNTGGIQWWRDGSQVNIIVTAGWRARSAGGFGSLYASNPWMLGNELQVRYSN